MRGIGVVAPVLLLMALGFPAQAASSTPGATPVREADAVCAKCHQEIFRRYLATPMANASGLATDRLIPANFRHELSGVEYQVYRKGDSAWLDFQKLGDPSIQGRERLDYFLGSGHLGITYLYSQNGYLFESPIAFYPELQKYDMKPGLGKIEHIPGALTTNSTCLRCHMSEVQRQDAGTENHYRDFPFLHVGITCESCHGDARQHAAGNGAAQVVNPGKLNAAARDSVCIVCHLEGTTSVESLGRSVLDFKPGENISDFITYFSYERENTTRRGVSEIEQLASSKCKLMSGDGMSCMSCHDPHFTPASADRAAFFRGKCLACHAAQKYATGHYSATPDCTSCHMPKTGAKNIPHVAWTDHRIRQHPEQENAAPDLAGSERQLAAILPGSDNARSLALAYYNLAVNGNAAEKPRATALLKAVAQSSPNDPAVLRAEGILAEWNGDRRGAQELYLALLKLDPDSFTATVNLGTLLAKSGDNAAAFALWRPAFERNEDVLGLGQNLATVECLMGEKDRAIKTLERVLVYSPDLPEIRKKLVAMETGSQQCLASAPPISLTNP